MSRHGCAFAVLTDKNTFAVHARFAGRTCGAIANSLYSENPDATPILKLAIRQVFRRTGRMRHNGFVTPALEGCEMYGLQSALQCMSRIFLVVLMWRGVNLWHCRGVKVAPN
jgi:hypothetical protein